MFFFFGMGTDMGIDLGTATVLVYIKGKGGYFTRAFSSCHKQKCE